MGLSFHYSGSITAESSLQPMIEEVKDIAVIYNWKFTVYENEFPMNCIGRPKYNQNIYGISFTPPNCETVYLCFLSNGKMSSPSNLKFYANSESKEEQEYLYMLSTKTQYAGLEIHKLIIHLLKYLSGKYFSTFTMDDEGEYWETGDEHLLKEIFTKYTDLIEGFKASIESFPIKNGEPFEIYFERLLKQIQGKHKS